MLRNTPFLYAETAPGARHGVWNVVPDLVRTAPRVALNETERRILTGWANPSGSPDARTVRARIILAASERRSNREIAMALGLSPSTVGRWRRRFAVYGLRGIRYSAPPARLPSTARARRERRVLRTLLSRPPPGARWSVRSLARHLGLNHMFVFRTLRKYGYEPRTALQRRGERRARSLDVTGLYLGPLTRGIAFARGLPAPSPSVGTPPGATASGSLPSDPLLRSVGDARGEFEWLLAESSRMLRWGGERSLRAARYDLLIFLQALERSVHGATSFEAIVFSQDPMVRQRAERWLSAHPRWRLAWADSLAEWTEAVERMLPGPRPGNARRATLGSIDSLFAGVTRAAGRTGPDPDSLVWMWRSPAPSLVPARPAVPDPHR